MSSFCWDTFLEFVTLYLTWSPLEVGGGYISRADACSCTTDVDCGNTLVDSGGKDSTVCQFTNIVRTASIASSC